MHNYVLLVGLIIGVKGDEGKGRLQKINCQGIIVTKKINDNLQLLKNEIIGRMERYK